MEEPDNKAGGRVHLEKLKAYLERSRLEYTETVNGNSTVLEIRKVERKEEEQDLSQKGRRGHG